MYFNHNYTISFDVGIYVNCESTGIVRLKIKKMRFIIRVDKLGNRESAIKIHDVACTPMMADSRLPSLSTLIMNLILIFNLTIPVDSQALPSLPAQ